MMNFSRHAFVIGLAMVAAGCASSDNQPQVQVPPYAPAPYAAAPSPAPNQTFNPAPAPKQVFKPAPAPKQPAIAAVAGTAFPSDGSLGRVPPGSRLVVRVYDAAGGDVNVRVAEGAFALGQGLPIQYKVPVAVADLHRLELPAVAARVETARGGVLYRNETAVLLKNGAPGDIPMTRQHRQAASAVTKAWD